MIIATSADQGSSNDKEMPVIVRILSVISLYSLVCGCYESSLQSEVEIADPIDSLDAIIAAPNSHIIQFENDKVRVLKVIVRSGEKEPFHTHQWESVMFVHQSARMNYYGEERTLLYQAPEAVGQADPILGNWMDAEGLHALENIDTIDFIATRVELKK